MSVNPMPLNRAIHEREIVMRFYAGFISGSLFATLALVGVFALTTIEYRSTLFKRSDIRVMRVVRS